MKLKKDWSLRHTLHYLTWLFTIGLVLNFFTVLSMYFISGTDIFMSVPGIDPLVGIDSRGMDLPDYETAENNFLMIFDVYVQPVLLSDGENFESWNYAILGARTLKFSVLFSFFFLLSRILRSIAEQNPFDGKNPRRLYIMGILLLLYPLLNFLHSWTIIELLNTQTYSSDLVFKHHFNLDFHLFIGMVILLLGYVFKEGARIHEEQKLTV